MPDYPTALGASTADKITLLGADLAEDVMGEVGFGELAFWLATQRRPAPGEPRVFEAVLAALADHGFTPTAIVTRLTAAEEDLFGPHLSLFAAIGRVHPQVLGKALPLNGAGACGAALADLGLPIELLRGFALLARTAGLIGQLAEELREPAANSIFLSVDRNNHPVAPRPYDSRRRD